MSVEPIDFTKAPKGTTHAQWFYGNICWFRKVSWPHLNQVSEEWETLSRMDAWDEHKGWEWTGPGWRAVNIQKAPGYKTTEQQEVAV